MGRRHYLHSPRGKAFYLPGDAHGPILQAGFLAGCRVRDANGEGLAPLFKKSLRFQAAERGCVVVAAEHRKWDDDILSVVIPFTADNQFSSAGSRFSLRDRSAKLGTRIERKRPTANTQEGVSDE